MTKQEKVTLMGVKELVLSNDIAELIYGADWEVRGTLNERTKDIIEHCMVDEAEVVEAIIKTVREADRR